MLVVDRVVTIVMVAVMARLVMIHNWLLLHDDGSLMLNLLVFDIVVMATVVWASVIMSVGELVLFVGQIGVVVLMAGLLIIVWAIVGSMMTANVWLLVLDLDIVMAVSVTGLLVHDLLGMVMAASVTGLLVHDLLGMVMAASVTGLLVHDLLGIVMAANVTGLLVHDLLGIVVRGHRMVVISVLEVLSLHVRLSLLFFPKLVAAAVLLVVRAIFLLVV